MTLYDALARHAGVRRLVTVGRSAGRLRHAGPRRRRAVRRPGQPRRRAAHSQASTAVRRRADQPGRQRGGGRRGTGPVRDKNHADRREPGCGRRPRTARTMTAASGSRPASQARGRRRPGRGLRSAQMPSRLLPADKTLSPCRGVTSAAEARAGHLPTGAEARKRPPRPPIVPGQCPSDKELIRGRFASESVSDARSPGADRTGSAGQVTDTVAAVDLPCPSWMTWRSNAVAALSWRPGRRCGRSPCR